ncbi:hypothetical protein C8A00DRAFT_30494 [Chaetomidium leptoderma]|uniref:Uncharacterized protein n=1 Tax=Chaetomidium leptoderma TaxID=669021 RepID=A0AAN6VTK9_9PEZI|nr:hypothetical protein C8A00DRAFT_30494 [Chaetomidium leptoderma]
MSRNTSASGSSREQYTSYSQQPASSPLDTTSGRSNSESSTGRRQRHRGGVSAGQHQDVPSSRSSVAPTVGSSGSARKEEVGGGGSGSAAAAAAAGYSYGYGSGSGSGSGSGGASTSSGSGTGGLGLTERNVRRTSDFYEYERQQRDKADESGAERTREAALQARLAEFSGKISGERK